MSPKFRHALLAPIPGVDLAFGGSVLVCFMLALPQVRDWLEFNRWPIVAAVVRSLADERKAAPVSAGAVTHGGRSHEGPQLDPAVVKNTMMFDPEELPNNAYQYPPWFLTTEITNERLDAVCKKSTDCPVELDCMRAEIAAWHGFHGEHYCYKRLESEPWYDALHRNITLAEVVKEMSEVELKNAEEILQYQRQNDLRPLGEKMVYYVPPGLKAPADTTETRRNTNNRPSCPGIGIQTEHISLTEPIKSETLIGKTRKEVTYLRDKIYAQHGYLPAGSMSCLANEFKEAPGAGGINSALDNLTPVERANHEMLQMLLGNPLF